MKTHNELTEALRYAEQGLAQLDEAREQGDYDDDPDQYERDRRAAEAWLAKLEKELTRQEREG